MTSSEPSFGARSAASADAEGRLPNFLIIGAPKAGTTSLADYLAGHPDVFVPEEKEVHFFDRQFEKGLDWYRSRFAGAGTARAVGDASPNYMYLDRTLQRIVATLPDARLLAVLRNPIDRAYSHYWWEVQLGERRGFEQAVRDELADVEGTENRRRYFTGGRYLGYLEKVCELFPREALDVSLLEDFRGSLDETYARVCRHIGVDDGFRPPRLGEVKNQAYRVRSLRLRTAMWKWHAWRRLPGGLADRIDRLNRAPFDYPPMDPGFRAELRALYAADNAALAGWLGRDLSAWDR